MGGLEKAPPTHTHALSDWLRIWECHQVWVQCGRLSVSSCGPAINRWVVEGAATSSSCRDSWDSIWQPCDPVCRISSDGKRIDRSRLSRVFLSERRNVADVQGAGLFWCKCRRKLRPLVVRLCVSCWVAWRNYICSLFMCWWKQNSKTPALPQTKVWISWMKNL